MKCLQITVLPTALLLSPFCHGGDPLDSWTEHRLATNDYGYLNAITYGSDQFVVVGTLNSSQFVHWNSSVGDNWKPTISEASGLVKGRLNALTYGDGNFVAVGTLGKILTSPDATHWTAGTIKTSDSAATNFFFSVAYGSGRFVTLEPLAVRQESAEFVSSDGTNWEKTAGATVPGYIRSICYGNGLFVAVGGNLDGDVIASSRDGTNWTSQTTATGAGSGWLEAVTYGGGRFVAIGSNGKILTSLDGNRWESLRVDTNTFLQAVCYGNGSFVAVGNRGAVLSSSNGTDWICHTSGTDASLAGVAYGNGRFVALANYGSVLVSQPIVRLEPNLLSGPRTTQLELIGTSGKNYLVQFSTNLTSWTDLTNLVLTSESGRFVDPTATKFRQGFYRVVIP